jgi:ribosomal protein S17
MARIYPVRHQLKTWPPYFKDVWNRRKTAEIRKDDRGFQVGDVVELQEWNPDEKEFTGNVVEVRITHILRSEDGDFGLKRGYVMLSFVYKTDRVF